MNDPQNQNRAEKSADASPSKETPEIALNGLGLPKLSGDAERRADGSGLEPDESVDLDETVRRDREVADENSS